MAVFNGWVLTVFSKLERSKLEKEKYYLYRVYEFNESNNQAKVLQIQGELTSLCETPMNYIVNIEKQKNASG